MIVGSCPSCNAPVEFRPGNSRIKVCEHCNTVVMRGTSSLQDLGKVAELIDTESPLKLNLSGRYSGTPFTVVGRIQKENATGTWDEWCLRFDDERTGWLSESEGDWNLMFPMQGVPMPVGEQLQPLNVIEFRERKFVIEEVGVAKTVSAQGELPDFNAQHFYADATGRKGVFASLDYPLNKVGGATTFGTGEAFVGNRVTLDQLGFDKNELAPTPRRDALSGARCTECNGMLELKAPDATKRVACPYCGALLDVSHGKLSFLQLLEKPSTPPEIPLGSTGTLMGTQWTVIAFLVRSCIVEGNRYPWSEYLLWHREQGFRWLMNSNGHWTFLEPISAGDVELEFRGAKYNGELYRKYQEVFARTEYVLGECYWRVKVDEVARATEYVRPPISVNIDQTDNEATFTLGRMLDPNDVKTAFKLKSVGTPTGIASAQVNPFESAELWKWTGIWVGIFVLMLMAFSITSTRATYFQGAFTVPAGAASGSAESQQFSQSFAINKEVPLAVKVRSDELANNWLGVSVDLVNEDTGEVISVYAEPSYYSGVDDGESWSEGSRDETKQTAEVDPGNYLIRVTPQFDASHPTNFYVTVAADGGPGFCFPACIFVLLLLVPLYRTVRASSFETQRWNDAVFQSAPDVSTFPYFKETSSSDDDD